MQVTKKSIATMEVSYTVTDSGGYVFMDRFTYPTDKPLTTKQIDGKINTTYFAWKQIMLTPVVKPTKKDLERELAIKHADKVAAEKAIATIMSAIAILDDAIVKPILNPGVSIKPVVEMIGG